VYRRDVVPLQRGDRLCVPNNMHTPSLLRAVSAVGLYFPMMLQVVRGNSASNAGLHFVPNTIATACGGIVSGLVRCPLPSIRSTTSLLTISPVHPQDWQVLQDHPVPRGDAAAGLPLADSHSSRYVGSCDMARPHYARIRDEWIQWFYF
jgi:hypothetical protein